MPKVKVYANRIYIPALENGTTYLDNYYKGGIPTTHIGYWVLGFMGGGTYIARLGLRFDVTSIPQGSRVNSATLSVYPSYVQSSPTSTIVGRYYNDLTKDILDEGSTSAWQTMYATGCGLTGYKYVTAWSINQTAKYVTVSLGNQAALDVEEQIDLGKQFSVALKQTSEASTAKYFTIPYNANLPYIEIDYTYTAPRVVGTKFEVRDALSNLMPRSGDTISKHDQLMPLNALQGAFYSAPPSSSGLSPVVRSTGQGGMLGDVYAYQVSYTIFDIDTHEMLCEIPTPSDNYKEVTITTGQEPANITLSGVPLSSHPLINGRRIYRSKIDLTGGFPKRWGLVGDIYNNVDSSFTDAVTEPDYSTAPAGRSELGIPFTALGQSVDYPVAPVWPEPVRQLITTGTSTTYTVPSGKILAIQSLCTTATGSGTTGSLLVDSWPIFKTTGGSGSPYLLRPILVDSGSRISKTTGSSGVYLIGNLMPRSVKPIIFQVGSETPFVRSRSDPPFVLTHVFRESTSSILYMYKGDDLTSYQLIDFADSGQPMLIDKGKNPITRAMRLDGEYSIRIDSGGATIMGYEENTS